MLDLVDLLFGVDDADLVGFAEDFADVLAVDRADDFVDLFVAPLLAEFAPARFLLAAPVAPCVDPLGLPLVAAVDEAGAPVPGFATAGSAEFGCAAPMGLTAGTAGAGPA